MEIKKSLKQFNQEGKGFYDLFVKGVKEGEIISITTNKGKVACGQDYAKTCEIPAQRDQTLVQFLAGTGEATLTFTADNQEIVITLN